MVAYHILGTPLSKQWTSLVTFLQHKHSSSVHCGHLCIHCHKDCLFILCIYITYQSSCCFWINSATTCPCMSQMCKLHCPAGISLLTKTNVSLKYWYVRCMVKNWRHTNNSINYTSVCTIRVFPSNCPDQTRVNSWSTYFKGLASNISVKVYPSTAFNRAFTD